MAKKKKNHKLSEASKQRIEKIKEQENLEARIIRELEENKEMHQYLEAYDEHYREGFLDSYAHHKYMWTKFANSYQSEAEDDALEYRPTAQECLWEIQQKKLFDLQCHWRAGKIALEGVQSTIDFLYWEDNIMICPCLEPITEKEVDMYISFLESYNTERDRWMVSWQDYNTYKKEYQTKAGDSIPDWYEFHNIHTGNGSLLILPDMKGEAEDRYLDALHEHEIKEDKKAGTYKETESYRPKPRISGDDPKEVEAFVRKFESKTDYTRYLHYRSSMDKFELNETIENELRILQDSTEFIPIESHSDWREAIRLAATAYENRMIARAMPAVYEDYLFKRQTGISYETTGSSEKRNWMDVYKQRILAGRKLLGEPGNFDY